MVTEEMLPDELAKGESKEKSKLKFTSPTQGFPLLPELGFTKEKS